MSMLKPCVTKWYGQPSFGVDVIPASIDDGFVASAWKELVSEHLPGVNQYEVLRKIIIDRVADDYDFILIDTGPHLDPFY